MDNNSNTFVIEDEGEVKYLKNKSIPDISLPNQEENLLRLYRLDTFRMVLYFFPMTGRPDRPLPENWNKITGVNGSTIQTCLFRDNYYKILSLNAVPIGVSSQTTDDNKEMTSRLGVPYDVLSDQNLQLKHSLNLPSFTINKKSYFKRLTLVLEKNIIKKVFYPVDQIDKHIEGVMKWLKEN